MVYCYATALDDWASQLERHHSVSALSPDGNVLAAGVCLHVLEWVVGVSSQSLCISISISII